MSAVQPPTSAAVSSDSDRPWADEGTWPVADGVYRIPLPPPMDALRAVNVYVVLTGSGLVLIDGGWGVSAARDSLERGLGRLGAGFADIATFLVTHVHRDHYTLASMLAHEHGAEVWLGRGDSPTLELLEQMAARPTQGTPFTQALVAAGIPEVVEDWSRDDDVMTDAKAAGYLPPTGWFDGDHRFDLGPRVIDAVHTPGHTPGHYVFADQQQGLLFAGDHVLPTITPSIGFVSPPPSDPLGAFLGSLAKVLSLPDLKLLPAHGPVVASSHHRAEELLAHHEERLATSLAVLESAGPSTAAEVAGRLTWTRHERRFAELEGHHRGMAALETMAHLDLLVARGLARAHGTDRGNVYAVGHGLQG